MTHRKDSGAEQTAPLLRKLSPELRNMIYQYALVQDSIIDITTEQPPGLTRACR